MKEKVKLFQQGLQEKVEISCQSSLKSALDGKELLGLRFNRFESERNSR